MDIRTLHTPEPPPTPKRRMLLVAALSAASFASGFAFSAMLGQERNAERCAACERGCMQKAVSGQPSEWLPLQEAGTP